MVNLGLFSEIKPIVSVNVRFRIPYYTQWGQSLIVSGSEPVLGSENVKKGLLLTPFHVGDELIWGGSLTVPNGSDSLPFKSAFKNVIFRKSSSLDVEKSLGVIQHKLDLDDSVDISAGGPNYIVISDGMMLSAGVAIPMFSVRSEDDVGVGEFEYLKLVVYWAVDSGFHLLQLLPINDTSVHKMWWDSYPYSSLSVFALHSLYLRLQRLSENIPDDINLGPTILFTL